jgi:predicted GIY-YIG superfamily endonuclease
MLAPHLICQVRLEHHNETPLEKPGWTQKNGPWPLVWSEGHHLDCASAVRRERQIKAKKSARWIREHLLRRLDF